ncbi:MAG TPA: YgiQ family radical SAM protein [Candidatus Aminicenantes bacterium]|nr:MAG: YgiQ family radical SAM protein [Candidatus Aminicenantes bacterium]HEK85875.1 YgiQ family radical SAM protein [Candidatus Aminicenantes bacterium]
MIALEGESFDIILVSGDPYADHPLSPVGVIARVLDAKGYRVGLIERPDWTSDRDFLKLGRPRLFFGVTSGSIDSCLANYTPLLRRREKDEFAPYHSGKPDRAVIVYCNKIKSLFPGVPIVIGGIEASLRRFAHYDYWKNRVRRSILLDSRADILVYGPGELQAIEIARRLEEGQDLKGIPGTAIVSRELPPDFEEIPSFEEVSSEPEKFIVAQRKLANYKALAQKHANRYVLQFPAPEYTPEILDWIYSLPFSRHIPPDYPELEMGKFSIVTHRGCLGRCSFCSLSLHQGDRIVSRSEESILEEIRHLTKHPDFKGYIDDLGGPTANMYGMDCHRCQRGFCLTCNKLDRSHERLINLLRRARQIPGVKKIFVRSGIRYDLALNSPDYVKELVDHHVSGLLKIAPEHISPRVLRLMNKSEVPVEKFRQLFLKLTGSRKQHLKYYFMVAHPGTTVREARELATYIKKLEAEGEKPIEGVQIFTPTPMTRSTCMYYTGKDPETGQEVYVPRTFEEKKAQKRLLQKYSPANSYIPRQKFKNIKKSQKYKKTRDNKNRYCPK